MRRVLAVGIIVVLTLTTGLAFLTRGRQAPERVLEHAVSVGGRDVLIRECVQYQEGVCRKYLYGQRPYNSDLDYWLLMIPVNRGNESDIRQVKVSYDDWLHYEDGQIYP